MTGVQTCALPIYFAHDALCIFVEYARVIPALESAHAIGVLEEVAAKTRKGGLIIVNVSGRGDKDVADVARFEGVNL